MNQSEFTEVVEAAVARSRLLLDLKGGEYAAEVDRLSNFKRNAAEIGVDPLVVWRVYAGKHWDALSTFIRDQTTGTERQRAEPIQGRVDDLVTYLLILQALLVERGPSEAADRGTGQDWMAQLQRSVTASISLPEVPVPVRPAALDWPSVCAPLALPVVEKSVLMELARRADRSGKCEPTVGVIARFVGISVRSVQSALKALAVRQLITREHRYKDASVYSILVERP